MAFNITPVASGYQEIHPYSAMNIDSVKINTSLIMMKECQISWTWRYEMSNIMDLEISNFKCQISWTWDMKCISELPFVSRKYQHRENGINRKSRNSKQGNGKWPLKALTIFQISDCTLVRYTTSVGKA